MLRYPGLWRRQRFHGNPQQWLLGKTIMFFFFYTKKHYGGFKTLCAACIKHSADTLMRNTAYRHSNWTTKKKPFY